MAILKASNIFKSYGPLHVLKGIHLEIEAGEIVSIVGASGAGKSTLLQILGTLDKTDGGELIINDTNISRLKDHELAQFRNRQLGFIFQFHNLLPEFTALENVCIPGYLGKKKHSEVEKRAKHLLEILGLSGRMEHKPSELSGGEQQRTAVARALVNYPSIIFADEPSGNLDSHNAEELHKLFFRLRDEFNQTFVIVTHNEGLAGDADRLLEMKDGVII
jgi:lipoprotein-releasing system ATP-binding protein